MLTNVSACRSLLIGPSFDRTRRLAGLPALPFANEKRKKRESKQNERGNDLRPNLQFVVDMLLEREGHTGGAQASTQSRGVQAKHTILTGLNLLGVLLSMRVPVLTASAPGANQLARTLPDVCLSYTQKNGEEITAPSLGSMYVCRLLYIPSTNVAPPLHGSRA